jgi:hypothetical protein
MTSPGTEHSRSSLAAMCAEPRVIDLGIVARVRPKRTRLSGSETPGVAVKIVCVCVCVCVGVSFCLRCAAHSALVGSLRQSRTLVGLSGTLGAAPGCSLTQLMRQAEIIGFIQ